MGSQHDDPSMHDLVSDHDFQRSPMGDYPWCFHPVEGNLPSGICGKLKGAHVGVPASSAVRKFAPLTANHPLVTNSTECPGCRQAFKEGDETTLITVGPGNDLEARERRDQGRPYNSIALPVHWECSTQE